MRRDTWHDVDATGMDMTPGGLDESSVPAAQQLGQVVELPKRVELLTKTTSAVIFAYISQVRLFKLVYAWANRV